MQEITREVIAALAAANGITIPEERLEYVRRQYESFMRTMMEIDSVSLTRETEPATSFALSPPALPSQDQGR